MIRPMTLHVHRTARRRCANPHTAVSLMGQVPDPDEILRLKGTS